MVPMMFLYYLVLPCLEYLYGWTNVYSKYTSMVQYFTLVHGFWIIISIWEMITFLLNNVTVGQNKLIIYLKQMIKHANC